MHDSPPSGNWLALRRQLSILTLRLLTRVRLALRMWLLPDNNPFLQRALRQDLRHRKPLQTLCLIFITVVAVCYAGDWLWDRWQSRLSPLTWNYAPGEWPAALGRNSIGFVALATAWITALGALLASRARAAPLLRQEVLKATLDQLQLIPVSVERWIWQMSAYPTLISLLIGLAGVPVYLLAILTGQWTPRDLAGLALVFVLIGHAAPTWQPVMWKQQTRRPTSWAQWRAAMKTAQGGKSLASMTTAEQMEVERSMQRLALEPGEQTQGSAAAAGAWWGRRNNQGGLGTFFGFFWMLNVLFMGIGTLARGGPMSLMGGWWKSFTASLPDATTDLFPGIVLTWPLVTARVLLAPLPFFALRLPPVVLIVPLWLLSTLLSNLTLAANVSSAETFWSTRRVRRRTRGRAAVTALALLLFLGYGWQFLVVAGTLSFLIPGLTTSTAGALAACWAIAIILGTLASGIRMEKTFLLGLRHDAPLRTMCRDGARAMIQPLVIAIGFYFVCCWVGGLSGVNGMWLHRLGPTLGIAGAFLLADYGGCVAQAAASPETRANWRIGRALWFWGPVLFVAAMAMYEIYHGRVFTLDRAPLVLISPMVSLFTVMRADLWRPTAPWWWGPSLQATIGAGLLLRVAVALWRPRRPDETEEASPEAANDEAGLRQWPRPVRWAWRVLLRCWSVLRFDLGATGDRLLRLAERSDNPVLLQEMKGRLRRESWLAQSLILFAVQTIFVGLYLRAIFQSNVTWPWMKMLADFAHDSRVALLIVLGAYWVITFLGALFLGQAFDRDRSNGTLVFLFLTPMRDPEILAGKYWPALIYSVILLLGAVPWMLVFAFAGVGAGHLTLPTIALAGFGVLLSTALFCTTLGLIFGVRARKPSEGSAKALLLGMILEGLVFVLVSLAFQISDAVFIASLVTVSAVHVLLAPVAWRIAVWSMKRQRYGDVTAIGKGAA